jgi:perosamine synthetase
MGSILSKVRLIPRYNWDYGFSDSLRALCAAFRQPTNKKEDWERIFGLKPIFTTSGRTSLYAILKSLNLPEGSNVGVPLFCCDVVFDAIRQANLIPKFIDINADDYAVSASDLKKKKNFLSAVIVVHMFGHPADMDAISAVCGNIPVIEDCAQSLYSTYKGNYTGFLSTVSFFSFRSGKYISAGEGSAIFTRDPLLRDSISRVVVSFDKRKLLQEIMHCSSTYIKSSMYRRPWYGTVGYPIGRRLDQKLNLTAKTGFRTAQISRSDLKIINNRIETFFSRINRQRENALYLIKNIKLKNVILPREKKDCRSNYYQFAIRFEDTEQRDRMADYLFDKGIDTAKYLNNIVDVAKEQYGYNGDCPTAEICSKTILSIPHYYTLSQRDIEHIVKSLIMTVKTAK